MSWEAKAMSCCGLGEIKGICNKKFDPEELFKWLTNKFQYATRANGGPVQRAGAGRGLYIFTLVHSSPARQGQLRLSNRECNKREKYLRAYIEENGLGELITLPEVGNPNYQNKHILRPLVYVPNQEAVLDFCITKGWAAKVPGGGLNYWITGT